jgi:hypothetical protein
MASAYAKPMSFRNVALSMAAVLGLWLAPWLAWRPAIATGTRRTVPRPPPAVQYVRQTPGSEGLTWASPMLFSLPSQFGFSGAAREGARGGPTFVKPPGVGPGFLPRAAEDGVHRADVVCEGLAAGPGDVAASVLGSLAAAAGPTFPAPTGRVAAVEVEVAPALAARGFQMPGDAAWGAYAEANPWAVVSAWVVVDAQGRVQHVFLDAGTGKPAADQAAVRVLRQARAERAAQAVAGRVRILMPPGAAPAGSPPAAGP